MPERHPGQVGDPEQGAGFDTDADGRPDTRVLAHGPDLLLATDRDGDGYAERVLAIGPDGSVRELALGPSPPVGPSPEPPAGWADEWAEG